MAARVARFTVREQQRDLEVAILQQRRWLRANERQLAACQPWLENYWKRLNLETKNKDLRMQIQTDERSLLELGRAHTAVHSLSAMYLNRAKSWRLLER